VLIELGGVTLLTDPVLRRRVLHLHRPSPEPEPPAGARNPQQKLASSSALTVALLRPAVGD
jgi:hypothetical protein